MDMHNIKFMIYDNNILLIYYISKVQVYHNKLIALQ